MKKLEDWKLPEVGSERVKQCMQDAVERALQLYQDNEVSGEYSITVGNLTGIFHDLSRDCDFGNKACINSKFKQIIDKVFDDITANEVLDILNDAYAIAIHAANKDFPEYEIRDYRAKADKPSRSTHARDMVLAFGAFLLKKCAQSDNTPDILKSEFANEIYFTLLGLNSLDVFYEVGPEYDSKEQEALDNLKKRLNPPPHPIEPLLDAIVRYAEALSPDEQSAIRAIGHMLHAKGAAGRYIPTKVYQKYEQRIDRLANWPKPEQGEVPVPAPHPGGEVQEEEPQETPTAAPAATPVPEPSTQKERIKAAISRLLDKRKEEGEKFCAKHWYAVYRVLAARELVAKNMKAFAELMNEMGFSDCKRSNLNSAQKEQKLPAKISEWFGRTRYEGGDKKLADVAQVFLSILREDNL